MAVLNKNRLSHKARFVALAISWTALSLVGCGVQKPSPTADTMNRSESSGSTLRMEIQVRNPLQLKRTALNDSTGNPERYAVDGELVEPGQAVSRMLAGRTICYSKLVNYEPYVGDQMSAVYSRTTKSESGRTVQYLEVARTNETGIASVRFVCMKLHMEVQPQEMRTAFGDLLKVIIL